MLSVESGFKTFRAKKWPFWVQNFEVLLQKLTNFRDISGCQWTLPERIYNPITAMGFSAMFTFQLNNTKR
jgi:hypothetical protein